MTHVSGMSEPEASILWKRVDVAGLDNCRLLRTSSGWTLSGKAVYREEGVVTALSYDIHHDPAWITRTARIEGWSGAQPLAMEITRAADGTWRCNSEGLPALEGCTDIDLGFTPATNTTAIRRLGLAAGAQAEAVAAWLDTGDWALKPLAQSYERLADNRYAYHSLASGFRATLTTEGSGLVTDYPGLWRGVP
ncbi:MAG: putative glycolipid-binding domain-containing protein [Pseudomonadota bacterium]